MESDKYNSLNNTREIKLETLYRDAIRAVVYIEITNPLIHHGRFNNTRI